MNQEVVILLAEDDPGHAGLIRKNLARAGIVNRMLHFPDGQAVLDFLTCTGEPPCRTAETAYILLLDIRMPKVNGVDVLRRIKSDRELNKIPTIMITTTDDPREVDACHALGCNNYITKPVDYDSFVDAIRRLGLFLSVVEVPRVSL